MAKRRRKVEAIPSGRPIIPDATDVDIDSYTVNGDGRHMQRTVFGLSPENNARVVAGYTCLKCLEDHVEAFPDACFVCGFPMRERQTEEYNKDFRGNIRYGPSTTIDEEYEIAEEQIAREAYDRATSLGLIIPKPSIIVPRDT